MPASDMILAVIGVVDYIFLLLFIVATGVTTRKEAREAKKNTPTETGKRAG